MFILFGKYYYLNIIFLVIFLAAISLIAQGKTTVILQKESKILNESVSPKINEKNSKKGTADETDAVDSSILSVVNVGSPEGCNLFIVWM
jgi:hypothetical protein